MMRTLQTKMSPQIQAVRLRTICGKAADRVHTAAGNVWRLPQTIRDVSRIAAAAARFPSSGRINAATTPFLEGASIAAL